MGEKITVIATIDNMSCLTGSSLRNLDKLMRRTIAPITIDSPITLPQYVSREKYGNASNVPNGPANETVNELMIQIATGVGAANRSKKFLNSSLIRAAIDSN